MREKERPAPPRPRDRRLLAEMRPPTEHAGQRPAPAITHPPMQTVDAAPAGAKLAMLQREIHKRMIIPQIPKRNHPLGGNAPPGKGIKKEEGGRAKGRRAGETVCAPRSAARLPPTAPRESTQGKAAGRWAGKETRERKAGTEAGNKRRRGGKRQPPGGKRAGRRVNDGGKAGGKSPGGKRAGRRVNDSGRQAATADGNQKGNRKVRGRRVRPKRGRQAGRSPSSAPRRPGTAPMGKVSGVRCGGGGGRRLGGGAGTDKKGPLRGPSHRRRAPQRMRRRKATPATPSASSASAVGSGAAS